MVWGRVGGTLAGPGMSAKVQGLVTLAQEAQTSVLGGLAGPPPGSLAAPGASLGDSSALGLQARERSA